MTNTNIPNNTHFLDDQKEGFGIVIAGILVALGALLFVGISTAHGQAVARRETNPSMVNGTVFTTLLSGVEEVPANTSTMSGRAHFVESYSRTGSEMHYQLIVHDGKDITGAHLHCGPRGVNGPVIINLLKEESKTFVHGELASGVIEQNDILAAGATCTPNIRTVAHLTQAMREGKVYVNVHTTQYPGGEIRGQVLTQMQNGSNRNLGTTSTMPHTNGTDTGMKGEFSLMSGGAHLTTEGLEIHEITGAAPGTSRYVVSISNDLLKRLGDMLSHHWKMIEPLLKR